jgi:ATP-binding cassette subfamily D (ALD) long-chain fatty acid import protein
MFHDWSINDQSQYFGMVLSRKQKIIISALFGSGALAVIYKILMARRGPRKALSDKPTQTTSTVEDKSVPKKSGGGGLNKDFWRQLNYLLRITVPNLKSPEFVTMIAIAIVQIGITISSNTESRVEGELLRALLDKNLPDFQSYLGQNVALFGLSSILNPLLDWLKETLAIRWRKRITQKIHDQYYSEMTYYRVSFLDSRIKSADQCITGDVENFCKNGVEMYIKVIRPIIDVIYFTYQLITTGGFIGPAVVMGYMSLSVALIRLVSPNFGKMSAEKSEKEGKFRSQHQRIRTYAESIAIYNGDDYEKKIANDSYLDLAKQVMSNITTNYRFQIFYDALFKYFPHTIVWIVLGYPIFTGRYGGHTIGEQMREVKYISSMIGSEFTAVANLMYLYFNLLNLSGYVRRVGNLFDVMKDLKKPLEGGGKFETSKDSIEFQGVTIKIPGPTGQVLASNLNFSVKPGKNTIITGPNGAGKSSLFRVLGSLWPLTDGIIKKPGNDSGLHQDIFYVPQKPYNCIGTLKEQIAYPSKNSDISDEKLAQVLAMVNLGHLLAEKGEKNWSVLSLGEQQKLAAARLFYHKPKFAILDECTSGVTLTDEKLLYDKCKELGICCITISHRPALYKYHDFELRFDGKGGHQYIEIKH